MDLKQLLNDDDAVSPVIGVILMVAITVILAAVIATFVLGLGDSLSNTAPQASFSFDYDNASGDPGDTLTVTHDGGDAIDGGNLDASVSGAEIDNSGESWDGTLYTDGSDVTAGTTDTISKSDFTGSGGTHLDLSGSTIRITYTAESGGSSATLGRWDGPEA